MFGGDNGVAVSGEGGVTGIRAPGIMSILVGAIGITAPNGKFKVAPAAEDVGSLRGGGGGFGGIRGGGGTGPDFCGAGGGGGFISGSPRVMAGAPLDGPQGSGLDGGSRGNGLSGGPPEYGSTGVSGGLPAESPGGCLVPDD